MDGEGREGAGHWWVVAVYLKGLGHEISFLTHISLKRYLLYKR
jgi:hypothetical protein